MVRQSFAVALLAGTLSLVGVSAQTAPANSSAGAQGTPVGSTPSAAATQKKAKRKRTSSRAGARTQVIPMETAPPTGPNPASPAQQRAADQALLQQQQAQSAAAAKATDQQVQRAQQRVDQQQREVRIQDAPGPAQTGVPGPAGMTQPVTTANPGTEPRIQDAPGPAQTLPQVPATQPTTPSSPTAPTTPPPQS